MADAPEENYDRTVAYKRDDNCPGCGHPLSEHGDDGCERGWEWHGPDAAENLVGLSKTEGCQCNLGLMQEM